MANPVPRVRAPNKAKVGEIIEIKSLISHEMESGQRRDSSGKVVPRKIIKAFKASFEGKEIMTIDLHPAISANPYLSFWVKAPASGTFTFEWLDDDGSVYKAEQKVTVS